MKVPQSLRIKHESEPVETFECKGCGDEITKYEYTHQQQLCDGCLKDLYKSFVGDSEND